MEHKTEHNIDILLAKFMAGEATAEEQAEILRWKDANAENQKVFEQSESLWKKAFDLPPNSFNADRAWKKIEPSLEVDHNKKEATQKSITPWYWMAAASIVALLLYFNFNQKDIASFEYLANKIDTVQLPDNSTVILAKNSSVVYSNEDGNRNIQLSGNAFFDVAKDAQHPFIIETKLGAIEVVGTSFDVVESQDTLSVLVASGKVKVAPSVADLDTAVQVFTVNQKAQAIGKKVLKSEVDDSDKFWRTKRLRFNDASLSKVLKEISKAYNIQIQSKLSTDTCRVTGKYDNLDVEQILQSLQELYAIEYQKSGDKWIVEGSTCQ